MSFRPWLALLFCFFSSCIVQSSACLPQAQLRNTGIYGEIYVSGSVRCEAGLVHLPGHSRERLAPLETRRTPVAIGCFCCVLSSRTSSLSMLRFCYRRADVAVAVVLLPSARICFAWTAFFVRGWGGDAFIYLCWACGTEPARPRAQ